MQADKAEQRLGDSITHTRHRLSRPRLDMRREAALPASSHHQLALLPQACTERHVIG
jgi:hypothetical protein